MLKKEELDTWNSIFPNCRISEADLKNPTEQFLISVLSDYLHEFGYKVDMMENAVELLQDKRLFLIKLVQHIDGILKISHKSYAFTYYDLICPTRKKTATILSILLNYLHYYNMYKMETIPKAKELVSTWKELQDKVARMQHGIQQNEEEAHQLKKEISTLTMEIEELNVAHVRAKNQQEEFEQQLKPLEDKLKALNTQKAHLLAQVVSNNEVVALQAELKQNKQRNEEVKQEKARIEKDVYERKELLSTLQHILQKLQPISSTGLSAFTNLKQELLSKERKMQEIEIQQEKLAKQINENTKSIKDKKKNLKFKCSYYKENFKTENALLQQTENELRDIKKTMADAEHAKHLLDVELAEQMQVQKFLQENIAKLNIEY